MSQPDSFLEEVTEEVRRDQMVRFLRRNAVWIAMAVVLIVGGAAYFEWQKSRARAAAEARGDALVAALEAATPQERLDALAGMEMSGDAGAAFLAMTRAAAALEGGDRALAVEELRGIASRGDAPPALRDVARLKLVSVGHDSLPVQERLEILDQLLAEGHMLRPLALEQRALIRLETGERDAAVADLTAIGNDARASSDVRDRAEDMLMVLGAAPDETGSQDG